MAIHDRLVLAASRIEKEDPEHSRALHGRANEHARAAVQFARDAFDIANGVERPYPEGSAW